MSKMPPRRQDTHTHHLRTRDSKPSPQVKIILLFESPGERFTCGPSQMVRIITGQKDLIPSTSPYKKMNGRLHTHTHAHTHTHTDEMFGQRQISRDFYFFLNTGLWGGIFFSSY